MAKKKYTFIDLFAGCGGLSEGFLQTGKFEGLAHVEWESPMINTLRQRLVDKWNHTEEDAQKRVIKFDVQKTDELINGNWSEETKKLYAKENHPDIISKGLRGLVGDTVDLIIGGPPCQAYSMAGRAQSPTGMKYDYRNYLFESFVKIVDAFKPKAFVFENVPGLLSACPGDIPVRNRIYEAFKAIGYDIRTPERLKDSIYCAEDYGVPQKRNRVIIIGTQQGSRLKVEDFYSSLTVHKKQGPPQTVRDAIGHYPKYRPLENSYKIHSTNVSHELVDKCELSQHVCRYVNKRDMEVYRSWIKNNMNHASTKERLDFYSGITGKTSHHIKYRNLEWDKPSPTIVAHLHKDGLMFIHPDISQLRSITIREAATLQSFPEDYKFIASNPYCYKMIGNAVPVLFSKGIAEAMYDVLVRVEKKKSKRFKLNVLVACEESQRVCSEFRRLGHNAYSCDLLECSGGHPEWHFKHDVLDIIDKHGGKLQNGKDYYLPEGESWDLMIAHPPCTFLAVSGARWFYHPDDKDKPVEQRRPHPRFPNRAKDRQEGQDFFMSLANAPIQHIAIENPVGIMNTKWRKPDQSIQPWMFGDEASKNTCLWLKNLPALKPTKIVGHGERVRLSSGRSLPKWYSDALVMAKTSAERRTLRSKTFPGFAKAMAEQWSEYLKKNLL